MGENNLHHIGRIHREQFVKIWKPLFSSWFRLFVVPAFKQRDVPVIVASFLLFFHSICVLQQENLDPSSLLFDLQQSSLGGLLYYQLVNIRMFQVTSTVQLVASSSSSLLLRHLRGAELSRQQETEEEIGLNQGSPALLSSHRLFIEIHSCMSYPWWPQQCSGSGSGGSVISWLPESGSKIQRNFRKKVQYIIKFTE
jgi:hypothetical protein